MLRIEDEYFGKVRRVPVHDEHEVTLMPGSPGRHMHMFLHRRPRIGEEPGQFPGAHFDAIHGVETGADRP
jgi:hypothetical protein